MNILDYVVKIDKIAQAPSLAPIFLNKVAVMAPASATYGGDLPTVIEIFDSAELSDYTSASAEITALFTAGLNQVDLLLIDPLSPDLPEVDIIKSNKTYTLIICSDFNYSDFLATGIEFDGVVGCITQNPDLEEALPMNPKTCAFFDDAPKSEKSGWGMFWAFGQLLSKNLFNDQQYIAGDQFKIGGITQNGVADNLFSKRFSFYASDEERGTSLAAFFAGGKSISSYYIEEEINYNLQQVTLNFITDNQPKNTEFNRICLQTELNSKIIPIYIKKEYLDAEAASSIIVSKSEKDFYANIDARFIITKPLWRTEMTIREGE